MANISDVEQTLVNLISAAIYPNGTTSPSAILVNSQSYPCRVYRGWPDPDTLDSDLAAGNVNISVFNLPGMDQNTTRFLPVTQSPTGVIPSAELTFTVVNNTVNVGGTINPGEAATLKVDYLPYSYAVLNTDTLTSVAVALAALIPHASVSGTLITIGGNIFDLQAFVSVPVLMQVELSRQKKIFQITCWCSLPTVRDVVGPLVDIQLKDYRRIVLPDNSYARLIYRGVNEIDQMTKQKLYRLDLRYEVEYITSQSETDNTVTNFAVDIASPAGTSTTVNI